MKKQSRTHVHYLQDISQAILDIETFTANSNYDDFSEDLKTKYAVIRALEIIGEATKLLPASLKKKYPEVPWKDMAGMRDILIHQYFGTDTFTVWETIQTEIPQIKLIIEKMILEATHDA